jgi:hypothetical protein
MANISQSNESRGLFREHPWASSRLISAANRSAARTDIALLVCALFLQRFVLPFPGGKSVSLSIAPATIVLVYQFICGRSLIQYDRLLWFLLLALAATCSLLLNFENISPTSYGLFLVLYFLFTSSRPSTADQYKNTLQSFQFLVLILSCIAIAQFPAQFILDVRKLIMFGGLFPEVILPPLYKAGANTIGTITVAGHSLIKSNGIFLAEPSTMSQIAAIAILIEVLVFRRPKYLIVLTFGLLLAYSGTGISILLLSLPLAILVNRRAQLPSLLVGLLGLGLLATGIIHLSAFTSRVGEFQNTGASGFIRFVSSFWQASDYLHTASLTELLSGKGPGYGSVHAVFYVTSSDTWFKLFLEYGAIGAFIFTCFCGSCFRKSLCPIPVIVGLAYNYLFTGNALLNSSYLILIIVLCTLSGPEARQQYRSHLVPGSLAAR